MADPPDGLRQALADRYAIERELGAGGMATVYLAADLKHPRKVAIKVLRPDLAAVVGAERFVQEVRVAATLQHPHILGLIDSGTFEGERGTRSYYVMPYVEGESLREKLKREIQLPIDEAVTITTAVASALDYAHRHGVIHRDIKPENILLHEGQALVADFGIALALQSAGGNRLTETGLALGTPQYMSPEQGLAEREIGPRSDVYALGCVVYEMLAGEPPFTGPTVQAIMAKVARDTPPPLRVGRPSVPVSVETAVRRALEKLPADRYPSAGDFAVALVAASPTMTIVSDRDDPRRLRRLVAAFGSLAAVLGILGLWGWLRPPPPTPEQRVARFEITLPPDIPARESFGSRTAIAPDGKSLVYLAITDGVRRLFLRALDQTTARPLAGTEGASVPFYSPDSKCVGFVAGGEMKKVRVAGGDPVSIATSLGVVSGASWSDGGVIVFSGWMDRGIRRVSAEGGIPESFLQPDSAKGDFWLAEPDFLPGGEVVLFDNHDGHQIRAIDLRTRKIVQLTNGSKPRYAGSGHLVFMDDDGVEVAALNPVNLSVAGSRRPVHIAPAHTTGGWEFAVSREGTLIYVPSRPDLRSTLVLVDRHGAATPLVREPDRFAEPRFSPDGRQVAVTVGKGDGSDIWVYGVTQPGVRRITFDGHANLPVWTPDGTMVAFGDTTGIFWTRADGAGSPRPMRLNREGFGPSDWTPDGRWLVAWSNQSGDLWRLSIDTAVAPQRLVQTPSFEANPMISPDGRRVAYNSNESGQWEVYVQDFLGSAGRSQVSIGGGLMPVWDRSGRELYYRSGNRLYSAALSPGPAFSVTDRRLLFESPELRSGETGRDYDVSPDGKRFVMFQRAQPLDKLVVVQNWFQELQPGK